ncbi:MAG: FAD-dependent oxidoreductase [Clostridiales bacterium]|nr:FAD-dependent oxidoreductase [Clostridiales bacterium]
MPKIYVATGYNKWGMTSSHVAANILADKILGKENKYEEVYSATRFSPIKNSGEMGNILKETYNSLIANNIKGSNYTIEDIGKEQGGVIEHNGDKVGIYKDKEGKIYAVKPQCKHLGCLLTWNNLDKTWDCPCHGSKYDYLGHVIYSPTVEDLDKIEFE